MGTRTHRIAQTKEREPVNERARITEELPAKEAYQLWANSYDHDANPALQLEERWLAPLLPDVTGLNVLDVGCGTGRWLTHFAGQRPAGIIGVDVSLGMLARAQAKELFNTKLLFADCCAIPTDEASVDLTLASFLLSYVPHMGQFGAEMARVCRSRAMLFVSDIHPATEKRLGWERGFRSGESKYRIETHPYEISGVVRQLEISGFELVCFFEPAFGKPELRTLEACARSIPSDFALHPAIYVAGFRRLLRCDTDATRTVSLIKARIAVGPEEIAEADLLVREDKVSKMIAAPLVLTRPAANSLDMTGYLLLPGLINAHDHLEYALFPRMGSGPYGNAKQWADSIYTPHAPPISDHLRLDKNTRVLWGGLRNLLSGVTTVCHHNPFHEVFDQEFPVHVLKKFAWAHSLEFDSDASAKLRSASPDLPFVIHLAEGTDESSAQEIFALTDADALDSRTVIVHGLALDREGRQLLRESGAALIWCPSSNYFLFGHTHTPESISEIGNVALGNDSPLTAAGDLLDEIRFAYKSLGMNAGELYRQVTSRAASILRLHDGQGHIRPNGIADLIAVRDMGIDPAQRLAELSANDIELVILNGNIQLASQEIMGRLPEEMTHGLRPIRVEDRLRWVRAPLGRMFRETHSALGDKWKLGGKEVRYALEPL